MSQQFVICRSTSVLSLAEGKLSHVEKKRVLFQSFYSFINYYRYHNCLPATLLDTLRLDRVRFHTDTLHCPYSDTGCHSSLGLLLVSCTGLEGTLYIHKNSRLWGGVVLFPVKVILNSYNSDCTDKINNKS